MGQMVFKVGVTGGIGSGKSSVAAKFAELDVPTFSSDALARELCQPDQAPYKQIVAHFGQDILNTDQTLNRSALGDIVFNDNTQLKQLEAILHPAIFELMHCRADVCDAPYCILDIPLLIGTAEQKAVQRILVVHTDLAIRKQRIATRNGWSEEKIQSVIDAQRSEAELLAAAHDVIENNTALDDLNAPVATLHKRYIELAKAFNQTTKSKL